MFMYHIPYIKSVLYHIPSSNLLWTNLLILQSAIPKPSYLISHSTLAAMRKLCWSQLALAITVHYPLSYCGLGLASNGWTKVHTLCTQVTDKGVSSRSSYSSGSFLPYQDANDSRKEIARAKKKKRAGDSATGTSIAKGNNTGEKKRGKRKKNKAAAK